MRYRRYQSGLPTPQGPPTRDQPPAMPAHRSPDRARDRLGRGFVVGTRLLAAVVSLPDEGRRCREQARSGRPPRPPRPGSRGARPMPGCPRATASTVPGSVHRSARRSPLARPSGRAHPDPHSYALEVADSVAGVVAGRRSSTVQSRTPMTDGVAGWFGAGLPVRRPDLLEGLAVAVDEANFV